MQDEHGESAMPDDRRKFQSENVMARLCLGVAVAGVNTLIVVGLTLAFVVV
jgi:hypothetical protein